MKKYEAMFIIKPELSGEEKKSVQGQINDTVTKNNGTVAEANIWAEKKKLCFPIRKYSEGTYYLMKFDVPTEAISKMRHVYKLNENILRVMITKVE